jgi:hemolysin III
MMSREEPEGRGPSRALELLVDRQVHRVGLAAAGLAGAWLIAVAAASGRTSVVVSVLVYAGGLLAMLGCSAAYNHSANAAPRREWLRRLDHAAIALMIAGTYTPFTVIKLTGTWSTAMTAGIWTIAGAGIAIKLLESRRLERSSVVFYLALGWMGLIALHPLAKALDPEALILLGVGGMLYTLGVIFHLWRSLPFQTAVWHGFVLLAAGCHYAAVLHSL